MDYKSGEVHVLGIESEVAFLRNDNRRHRQNGRLRFLQPSFTDLRKGRRCRVRSPIRGQVGNGDNFDRNIRLDVHWDRNEIDGLEVGICVDESFQRSE